MKSFGSDEPPSSGRNGERDFHGETRSNDTHASTTDPQARLYRKGKGKEAKLSYIGNSLTERAGGGGSALFGRDHRRTMAKSTDSINCVVKRLI